MTEYMFNPRYVTPETAESISAHKREPVPFRPITYRDAPTWTLLGARLAKEDE